MADPYPSPRHTFEAASGRRTDWSYAFKAPFTPASRAYADPRRARLYDTVTVTAVLDDIPTSAGFVIGEGTDIETAMYEIAQTLDGLSDDFHAFSRANSIGLQAAAGHTALISTLTVTPFVSPPAPAVVVALPAAPVTPPTSLSVSLTHNGTVRAFSTTSVSGAPMQDAQELANVINANYLFFAEAGTSFKVGTHPGHTLTVAALVYG